MACAQERAKKLLTIAEFQKLPAEDAYRIELVRGQLVREPRPAPLHGRVLAKLSYRLEMFAESSGAGMVLVDIGVITGRDPDTVRGPDIAWYASDRVSEASWGERFWDPPDLAVEILSPSNRPSAMRAKVAEYLDAGVRAVWEVNPLAKEVSVHRAREPVRRLGAGDALEGDDVLPGFRLPLATLFAL